MDSGEHHFALEGAEDDEAELDCGPSATFLPDGVLLRTINIDQASPMADEALGGP